jgi:hypothetical protein
MIMDEHGWGTKILGDRETKFFSVAPNIYGYSPFWRLEF